MWYGRLRTHKNKDFGMETGNHVPWRDSAQSVAERLRGSINQLVMAGEGTRAVAELQQWETWLEGTAKPELRGMKRTERSPGQLLYWAPMEPRWSRVRDKEIMVMETGKNDMVVFQRVETSLLRWESGCDGVELLVRRTDELWDVLSPDYKRTVMSAAERTLEEEATGRTWQALCVDVEKELAAWTQTQAEKEKQPSGDAIAKKSQALEEKLVDEKWWDYLEAELEGMLDEQEVRQRWVDGDVTGDAHMLLMLAASGALGEENTLPDRSARQVGRGELPGPIFDVVKKILEETGVLIVPQSEGELRVSACNGTHRNKCAHTSTNGSGSVITVAGAVDMSWQTWANFDLADPGEAWWIELERLVDWYADWMDSALKRAGTWGEPSAGKGLETVREIGCLELLKTFDRKEVWKPVFRQLELDKKNKADRVGMYDWELVLEEGVNRPVVRRAVNGKWNHFYSDDGEWWEKLLAVEATVNTSYQQWGVLMTGKAGTDAQVEAVLKEWPEELRSRIGAF